MYTLITAKCITFQTLVTCMDKTNTLITAKCITFPTFVTCMDKTLSYSNVHYISNILSMHGQNKHSHTATCIIFPTLITCMDKTNIYIYIHTHTKDKQNVFDMRNPKRERENFFLESFQITFSFKI